MIYSDSAEDYRPVMWLRGHAVSLSILLIVIHTLAMIFFSVARATGHGEFLDYFIFSSRDIWQQHQFWRLGTYAFVALPSVGFVIQMLMLYWFGPEVERFVGRSLFLRLYGALLLLPSLFLSLAGLYHPMEYAGPDNLLFGFFIAFAAIYPNVEILFLRLTVKWLAVILLGIYSLIDLSERQVSSLALLWLCTGIGYGVMRFAGVGKGFSWWEKWQMGRKESRRKKRLSAKPRTKARKDDPTSIDAILDKISKKGISSLTPAEKTALENARSALLKRDQNK
jgi:membrane associated rhomboid family serine protease